MYLARLEICDKQILYHDEFHQNLLGFFFFNMNKCVDIYLLKKEGDLGMIEWNLGDIPF